MKLLGSGSFAAVYLVRHSGLLSLHAIKVLDEKLAGDPDLRNRFLAEGQIQAQLRHPNVVAVTDIVTDPAPGLVLEYAEGPTLAEYLTDRGNAPPPIRAVLDIMLPILEGVGAAHRKGIVHRDLKPDNIILTRDAAGKGRPMVTDFGIAKVMDDTGLSTQKRRTEGGVRMGTVQYMSPEQVRGLVDLDARSDIFALGAILYEVVTGRMAFDRPSAFDSMKSIVDGEYEPPERLIGGLPPMFAACIRKALAVDPSERFADCDAFRSTLALAEDPRAPLPERPSKSAAISRIPEPTAAQGPASGLDPRRPGHLADRAARGAPPGAGLAPPRRRGTGRDGGRDDAPWGQAYPPPGQPYPQQGSHSQPGSPDPFAVPEERGMIPVNFNHSAFVSALLNICCLPGLGQMYNGQFGKGLLLLMLHVVLALITFGGSLFITWPVAIIDGCLVASKRRRQPVGSWEWF
ncbi:MAG: serine/threonine protein kinase [Deltaproteobacteria bacterium]|nr:serine/threonine protein kinase [Deltaproteobacteria bacterium]